MWPFSRTEKRTGDDNDDYTYSIIAGQESALADAVRVDQTAAQEVVAGELGRAFLAAEVTGDPYGLVTPEWLNLCGRDLVKRGQHVSLDTAEGLLPVESVYWKGERALHERDWRAEITLQGPSYNLTRNVSRDKLIVVRWANTSGRPFDGQGAHHFASLAARASAESERAAGDDQATPVAPLITVPSSVNLDPDDPITKKLRADLAGGKGKPALVPTMNDAWAEDKSSAPQRDWNPTRMGPNPTAPQVNAASAAYTQMLAAYGMPVSMWSATTAQAAREGLRLWYMGTVLPMAKLVQSELRRYFATEITIKPDNYGMDLQGRAAAARQKASALKTLIEAGLSLEEARAEVAAMFPDE